MDIVYKAAWKDKTRTKANPPTATGIGRLALALCIIALTVTLLENASGSRNAFLALNDPQAGSMQ